LFGAAPPRSSASSIDTRRLSLPDKPSIAVLPFDNMSSDPEQSFLADHLLCFCDRAQF